MTGILVTRPREDSESLAARLRARGFVPLIEPLLTIAPLAAPDLDLAGVQAIAVTSANGARALGRVWPAGAARLPVYAVGPASARVAAEQGFAQVFAGSEDVAGLAQLIAARLDPGAGAGAILHVAGATIAGDLAGLLAGHGFAVRRVVLYRADAAESLSPAARQAIAAGEVAAVMLFSPRTAATFASLVLAAGLAPACAGIDALCLSARVADAVASLPLRRRLVAAGPGEDAMLALLH